MKRLLSKSRFLFSAGLIVSFFAGPLPTSGAGGEESRVAQQGGPRIGRHAETGKVNFIGFDPSDPRPLARPGDDSWTFEGLAEGAIRSYADDFGFGSNDTVRLIRRGEVAGGSSVRYQQLFRGVPVLAGEIIVNLDARGNLRAMAGEISPDLKLSVDPELGREDAADNARAAAAKVYGVDPSSLEASEPSLWIFDERLLRPSPRPATLVWRTEVTPDDLAPIRQLVLVDAARGQVVLQFNQIDSAKNRTIYDNNNNPALGLPGGGPFRTEGGAPSGIADVNAAYDYSGHTYDFFFTHHGRDSIDGAGMGLVSTTRYCNPAYACPYENAFWNGAQMVYGQGYASADDVVGHELTHGVTENESSLFYYYQSGAINESFSDVWGEFIDQTNGAGDDTPGVKWLMGEDVPGGAIRSMSNPPAYGDPDKMTSVNYYEGAGDNGGVHWNSGINNKAAFLMTDGGAFNGETVSALGITKVAAIYYEVQTGLLTSGGDYGDLYHALYQGCLNLVGGADGIVLADCQEVLDAIDAVEMNLQPVADFNTDAAFCPTAGQYPVYRFLDDLESGSGAWGSGALVGSDRWLYGSPYGPFAHSGDDFLYADDYPDSVTDTYVEMTSPVTVPTGGYLHFDHAYGFDDWAGTVYDGGVLEYSMDGGAWTDAGSLIQVNGYDGTIDSGWGNPLGGRQAFGMDSHGYISSRVNLSSMAGHEVRFRWRMGLDSGVYDWGWWIDDVAIYNCVTPTFNDVPPDHWGFVYIELIYQDGFVAGCSADPPLYCPENGMTRAEGAVFVERGIHGGGYLPPDPGSQVFADVPLTEWYAKWATGLWDDGYTAGCGTDPLIYCPLVTHSRAEGAVFYLRMLNGAGYVPPTPSVQIFSDVPLTEWYAKWVNAAWEAGIVLACATTPDLMYCPNDALDRSTAAYMMVQSKELLGP
jgi:bacillolysin